MRDTDLHAEGSSVMALWVTGMLIMLSLTLSACAFDKEVIRTKEILIEKPVPCKVDMPVKPALSLFDPAAHKLQPLQKLDMTFADYEAMQAYIGELEVRLEGCRRLPE